MDDRLKCLVCGLEFSFVPNQIFCHGCGQPGLFQSSVVNNAGIKSTGTTALERFASFLPLGQVRPELSLGEGQTPLLALNKLDSSGCLLAKLESSNPTLSFKDRGSALVVQKALELGWSAVGTVSTGNMASSTAAYAARAGLKCILLVKKGTSAAALLSSAIFHPLILEVGGDYGQLFRESYGLGQEFGIYFANSVDPVRLEGYKLTAFELCLQLGRAPDYVYVPVSSGGHFVGLYKGFIELGQAGYIEKVPVMVGVQAAGCAPIASAFEAGQNSVSQIQPSETIAHSIANPDPPAGNLVLKMVNDYDGFLTSVTDEDMLLAQKQLARDEGLFVQPESASALAAYFKLRHRFVGTSVLVLTGQGLKASHQPGIDNLTYQVSGVGELKEFFRSVYSQK
ncbi:MAG: threonine synthase [Candidatus Saccharicenans sp.]|jgi:threonine synthase|nr:threonine synthase [Candidatus Saccharicenans sp.]MDH7575749.1 threonine synthase [Candidatus Saccharicenans sp.]